jgi:hypothetical protein
MFKDGRTNIRDEERSGRPSVVSDVLVQNVEQNMCERRRFTIKELAYKFPQISLTILYEIITVRLRYHKFSWYRKCSREHTKRRKWLRLWLFLERYRKDGDQFLNHIVRVTGDETWVSFLNVETKDHSKQWMHTRSPNKPKKCKHCLPARKLMTTVFWEKKVMRS